MVSPRLVVGPVWPESATRSFGDPKFRRPEVSSWGLLRDTPQASRAACPFCSHLTGVRELPMRAS
eukprot:2744605-Alexandrium_andersonii.AAC.1